MIDFVALTGRPVDSAKHPFLPALNAPLLDGCMSFTTIDTAAVEAGAIYSMNPEMDFETAKHRYALWRVWDPNRMPLVVIGLNPSTATHLITDPTIRRDIGYARNWGMGGLVKVNINSLRSTDPAALYEGDRTNPDPVTGGYVNNAYIRWFCESWRAGLVLCAWGEHGALFNRGNQVATMLTDEGVRLFALDVNRSGNPKHTLYMKADKKPQSYKP